VYKKEESKEGSYRPPEPVWGITYYIGESMFFGTPVKNWTIPLERAFTSLMLLLMLTAHSD